MKKKIDIVVKIIAVTLAVIFLGQSFSGSVLIPIKPVLEFFGIGNGILDIVLLIVYVALLAVAAGFSLSLLNRFHIVTGLTKNNIILWLIVKAFMLFVIFFPTFISYFILGGTGLLGQDIKIGISNNKALSDLSQLPFLNLYLFWYLLVTAFIKPEIIPEWGIKKNEEAGLI
jgi:hypothetical protein